MSASFNIAYGMMSAIKVHSKKYGYDVSYDGRKGIGINKNGHAYIIELDHDNNVEYFIKVTLFKLAKFHSFTKFYIMKNIYDDSTSISVIYKNDEQMTYLVCFRNMALFICGIVFDEIIDWSLTYKNVQKIRSSSYGRSLYDVSIICCDEN